MSDSEELSSSPSHMCCTVDEDVDAESLSSLTDAVNDILMAELGQTAVRHDDTVADITAEDDTPPPRVTQNPLQHCTTFAEMQPVLQQLAEQHERPASPSPPPTPPPSPTAPLSPPRTPREAAVHFATQANAAYLRIQESGSTERLYYEVGPLPVPYECVHPRWLSDPNGVRFHATRIGGPAFGTMVGDAELALTAILNGVTNPGDGTDDTAIAEDLGPEASDPVEGNIIQEGAALGPEMDSPLTELADTTDEELDEEEGVVVVQLSMGSLSDTASSIEPPVTPALAPETPSVEPIVTDCVAAVVSPLATATLSSAPVALSTANAIVPPTATGSAEVDNVQLSVEQSVGGGASSHLKPPAAAVDERLSTPAAPLAVGSSPLVGQSAGTSPQWTSSSGDVVTPQGAHFDIGVHSGGTAAVDSTVYAAPAGPGTPICEATAPRASHSYDFERDGFTIVGTGVSSNPVLDHNGASGGNNYGDTSSAVTHAHRGCLYSGTVASLPPSAGAGGHEGGVQQDDSPDSSAASSPVSTVSNLAPSDGAPSNLLPQAPSESIQPTPVPGTSGSASPAQVQVPPAPQHQAVLSPIAQAPMLVDPSDISLVIRDPEGRPIPEAQMWYRRLNESGTVSVMLESSRNGWMVLNDPRREFYVYGQLDTCTYILRVPYQDITRVVVSTKTAEVCSKLS